MGLHFSMRGPVDLSCFCGSKRQSIQGGIFGMAGFKRFLDIFVKSGEDRMDSARDVRRATFSSCDMCHEIILI